MRHGPTDMRHHACSGKEADERVRTERRIAAVIAINELIDTKVNIPNPTRLDAILVPAAASVQMMIWSELIMTKVSDALSRR